MKIAVISDVHSNLVALEAVQADIKTQCVDEIHCLGDTLGYGPWPLECLNVVLAMCQTVLKGNHEDAVCHNEQCSYMNKYAVEGVKFSRSKLTPEIIEGIDKFPMVKQFPNIDFVLCHGSYTKSSEWRYLDAPYKTKRELEYTPNRICLIGHTHNPFVFGNVKGLYEYLPDDLELDNKQKFIVNVGSVGQPRDSDCRASYGIFEINDGKVIFNLRRVFYDISRVEKAIKEAGISYQLADRLYSGR